MRLRLALVTALVAGVAFGCGSAAGTGTTTTAPSTLGGGRWLTGVTLSEYWPVPERWFRGARVTLRGLPGRHRVDWAYSGTGLAMEGDGVALDGARVHVSDFGSERWVNPKGQRTKPTPSGNWTKGDPGWRVGGWRNAHGAVTFPLERGGWSNGPGVHNTPLPPIQFATGPSLPLVYYRSIAVDPKLIRAGSRVYIPAYHRWFVAQDTGSGIIGRHVDVFRPPPATPDGGRFLERQRIYVIAPGRR